MTQILVVDDSELFNKQKIALNKFLQTGDYNLLKEPNWPENKFILKSDKSIGRNNPCPCGSGKKYKKCCLNKKD